MNAPYGNVLSHRSPPVTKDYRDAVAEIIGNIQGKSTDWELAQRLQVSAGTIRNARRKRGSLDGATLARIAHFYGPAALNPFMRLAGGHCVPAEQAEYIQIIDVIPTALPEIATLSEIARDGRIDYRERPRWRNSCDRLVEIFIPISSIGASA